MERALAFVSCESRAARFVAGWQQARLRLCATLEYKNTHIRYSLVPHTRNQQTLIEAQGASEQVSEASGLGMLSKGT
jgi:hypothetical protein